MLIFAVISFLSFVLFRDVEPTSRQLISSSHSPSSTVKEGTKIRASPTRIVQRAEKLSNLVGVNRDAPLVAERTEAIVDSVSMSIPDCWSVKCNLSS